MRLSELEQSMLGLDPRTEAAIACGRELSQAVSRRHLAERVLTLLEEIDLARLDDELRVLLPELEREYDEAASAFQRALEPDDAGRHGRVLVEIRQGVGGTEAALWVETLERMYRRFCERSGFAYEQLSRSANGGGGSKEVTVAIEGINIEEILAGEGGVHRVQRVSPTDSRGRMHTSAATVAVLNEPEGVEIVVNEHDLRTDIFHAGGNGGQNVNKVATAVRLVHLPTGLTVVMQDERQQGQNREKALRVLTARLADQARKEVDSERRELRKAQIGCGDRSEKTRTYNYPENRVTDHRIGRPVYALDRILDGQLELIIKPLQKTLDNDSCVTLPSLPDGRSSGKPDACDESRRADL